MKVSVSSYSFMQYVWAGKMTQFDCVAKAKELGFYMQKYCGCVFSEEERYLKKSKIIP